MTARLVSSGKAELEAWSVLPDADLREKLCALPGVGAKVANCVMLFAFERLRAFPIDVWIERVLKQQYFPRKKKVTTLELREFSRNIFWRIWRLRAAIFVSSCAYGFSQERRPTVRRADRQDARLQSQAGSLTPSASCQAL